MNLSSHSFQKEAELRRQETSERAAERQRERGRVRERDLGYTTENLTYLKGPEIDEVSASAFFFYAKEHADVRLWSAGRNVPRVQSRVHTVLGHRVDGACNVGVVQATHSRCALQQLLAHASYFCECH